MRLELRRRAANVHSLRHHSGVEREIRQYLLLNVDLHVLKVRLLKTVHRGAKCVRTDLDRRKRVASG